MRRILQPLPFMLLLFILPFPGTVALRLACLAAAFLVAVFSWRELAPPSIPCKWAIAFWVGVVLASLAYAVDPTYSLGEIRNEIGYSLMAFVAFFAWTVDERRLRLGCLAVFAAFAAVSVSALNGYAKIGEWPPDAYYGGVGVVSNYLVTISPVLALTVALYWPRREGKLLALSGAVFLEVALLSGQRALWPAIALQAALGCIWLWRSHKIGLTPFRLALTALLLLALLAGALYLSERFRAAGDSQSPVALQNDLRPHLWKELGKRIAERPLTGHGFGRRALSKAYPDLVPSETLWHAHNLLLNYGVSAGVPGMISVLVLFAALAWRFWRLALGGGRLRCLVGLAGTAMVAGVFVRNMANDFFVRDGALLFWALAGMLFGYALRRTSSPEEGRPDGEKT